jgi:hypothetical protein
MLDNMGMIALTATLIINKGEKMKQTAVEWLLQRFEDGDMYNVEDAQFIKHQALAMEKEQIVEARENGLINGVRSTNNFYYNSLKTSEQYYNETYKGGQDG